MVKAIVVGKSLDFGRTGSSPVSGTSFKEYLVWVKVVGLRAAILNELQVEVVPARPRAAFRM